VILFCYWERGQGRGKVNMVEPNLCISMGEQSFLPSFSIYLHCLPCLLSVSLLLSLLLLSLLFVAVAISVVCSVVRSVLH
jgi:hypothetical protein